MRSPPSRLEDRKGTHSDNETKYARARARDASTEITLKAGGYAEIRALPLSPHMVCVSRAGDLFQRLLSCERRKA